MGNLYNVIAQLCEKKGVKGAQMCADTGISKGLLTDLKMGRRSGVSAVTAQKIASYFGVSVAFLLGNSNDETHKSEIKKVPVFGNVAAGIPTEAITDIEDYEEIPADWQGEYAALRIKGDSMAPRILDGDIVIIRVQGCLDNGDIGVFIIDGESTCKRYQKTNEGITLIPLNAIYTPMFYTNSQIKKLGIRIFGKVVELRGKL